MHPQVKADKPGKCPICHMELIAVPKNNLHGGDTVQLTALQQKLGNISTDTIRNGSFGQEEMLQATLAINEEAVTQNSARIRGRIQNLRFRNPGDIIHRGDKLYDLYSEELNNTKQEYLNALEQKATLGNSLVNYDRIIESARNRLLLWGIPDSAIIHLERTGKTSSLTSFYSSTEGTVTTVNKRDGDYAMDGESIYALAGLTTLWAEARVNISSVGNIEKGMEVVVQVPALNNFISHGKIDFINPELEPGTKTILVRVIVPNSGHQLQAGMQANVILQRNSGNGITLPADAVLRGEKSVTVWLQITPGVFTPRKVETGIETGNRIEIKSGLMPGDIIVVSGAYLVNSEFILTHGSDPMATESQMEMH